MAASLPRGIRRGIEGDWRLELGEGLLSLTDLSNDRIDDFVGAFSEVGEYPRQVLASCLLQARVNDHAPRMTDARRRHRLDLEVLRTWQGHTIERHFLILAARQRFRGEA